MSDLIIKGRVDTTELEEQSYEEGNWEPIAGDPAPRVQMICDNADTRAGISAVNPSTLSYTVERATTIHVLEGEGTVTVEAESAAFRPGDVLCFSPGSQLEWEFKSPFRDLFVATAPGDDQR